ncbi:uncharacterized protein LOC130622276 [Hydractinia symbiolongicarpus]|uniref:uncharacterized protein LOC130622276 n=1 Tax=Hydractinia symbiolongicarpus TaxID=13093 RepID=UPI002549D896|nr:uncharacterized protein LOC130622276 [Hydractinia symbiolongicarpus]XP_057293700.1 uncharacterized protein LOC130622276 [Hydractinia symbiolongicarpus]
MVPSKLAFFILVIATYSQGKYLNTRCFYKTQDEILSVECNPEQSCYAIVSLKYNNKTWHENQYAMGCWETLPYCSQDTCDIPLPNYIWVEHHFPRFCCCKGNLCNGNIKTII